MVHCKHINFADPIFLLAMAIVMLVNRLGRGSTCIIFLLNLYLSPRNILLTNINDRVHIFTVYIKGWCSWRLSGSRLLELSDKYVSDAHHYYERIEVFNSPRTWENLPVDINHYCLTILACNLLIWNKVISIIIRLSYQVTELIIQNYSDFQRLFCKTGVWFRSE